MSDGRTPTPAFLRDRYEFLHELGRGAMGVVWLARERGLDRLVAIKIASAGAVAGWGARLLREGKAAASLRHPNIVAVFAMGQDGAEPFLAMEFIEGGNLESRIAEGPMPFAEAAAIGERMAEALSLAHSAGLLHRDVKPSNILIDEKRAPRLADFGLATALQGAGDLTQPGHIVGTPAYIAPELLAGAENASAASDIYGLGAVLFTCITGRAPFVGDSAASILAQIPTADPTPPRLLRPNVPRDLETICLKCLEKAPSRRYASAALLQSDLLAFLSGSPITARPLGFAGRLARSCRRHPALAISTTLALVCLLVLAIGGPVMALRLSRARGAAEELLRQTLLDRSRATRLAGDIDQRNIGLKSAVDAARIRSGLDARDEAIASLARPQIVSLRDWEFSRVETDGVITFNPQTDHYAVETQPGTIEVRTISDGHLLRTLTGPKERLWTFPVMSADGQSVVSRNNAGTLVAWTAGSDAVAWSIPNRAYALTKRFTGYGQPDAFSPDGRMVASAMNETGISIMSAADGHEVARIPTDFVATHVAYSNDGRMLAVGRGLLTREGRKAFFVGVYDSSTLRKISDLRTQKGFQSMVWDPEGNHILTSGGTLDMYQVSDGALMRSIDDPPATRGYFGPRGTTLISNTSEGGITLWDLESGRPLLFGVIGAGATSAVNRDGDLIAYTTSNLRAKLCRIEMSDVVRVLRAGSDRNRANVTSAAVPIVDYSPDGRWIATGMWGMVQLRDRSGATVVNTRVGTYANYTSVKFDPDSKSILVGTAEEGLLRFPILDSLSDHPSIGTSKLIDNEHPEFITDVSSDGKKALVTSFLSDFVKVIPLAEEHTAIRWPLKGAAGAAFLEDGRSVVANSLETSPGMKIEVRSAEDAHLERTLPFPTGAHITVSRDGTRVVLGSGTDNTFVVDPTSWSSGVAIPGSIQGRGNPCALSPDGRTLAVGKGKIVWLVDIRDGSVLAHLEGAQAGGYIPGLAFSPDGKQLSVLYDGGELSVWDLEKLQAELIARGLGW